MTKPKHKRTLRKEDIATALGVHTQTVLQWAKADCPHTKDGRKPYLFNLDEVKQWMDRHARTGRPGRPPGIEAANQQQAKLALTIEQAQLIRLRRHVEEGKLHSTSECRQRRLRQIQAVKSRFLALPRSISSRLVGCDRRKIETILADRIERILNDFAGGAHE